MAWFLIWLRFFFSSSCSTSQAIVRTWGYVFSWWLIKSTWMSTCNAWWNLLAYFSSSTTVYWEKWLSLKNLATYSSTDRFHYWSQINCSSISFWAVADWGKTCTPNTKFQNLKKGNVQVLNSSAIASGYAGRDPQGGFCDRSVTFFSYWNRYENQDEDSSLFLKLTKRKRSNS